MEYRFYTLDVFADGLFSGNQLAVLPSAGGLDDALMQRIAKEFGYSETAFVTPAGGRNVRNVRIFTPESEVDFAGHPTIGTAILLARIGDLEGDEKICAVFREKIGDIPVTVLCDDAGPVSAEFAVAMVPERMGLPPMDPAAVISLDPSRVLRHAAFTCGLPYLMVEVSSLGDVGDARLDHAAWRGQVAGTGAPNVFVFSQETEDPGRDFHARMFAPALGVSEDPATGSAAAALAGYVSEFLERGDGEFSYLIEQGFEMKRPSIIEMSFSQEGGQIRGVRVGGRAAVFSKGTILL